MRARLVQMRSDPEDVQVATVGFHDQQAVPALERSLSSPVKKGPDVSIIDARVRWSSWRPVNR